MSLVRPRAREKIERAQPERNSPPSITRKQFEKQQNKSTSIQVDAKASIHAQAISSPLAFRVVETGDVTESRAQRGQPWTPPYPTPYNAAIGRTGGKSGISGLGYSVGVVITKPGKAQD